MPALYTISQESSWKAGDILSATKLDASGIMQSSAIDDEEIVDCLHHNFPEGLSLQGCNYFMDTSKK